MWELLIELIKSGLKKAIKVPKPKKLFGAFKRAIKSPSKILPKFRKGVKKKAVGTVSSPVKSVKGQIKKAKRLGRITRFALSPKYRAIEATTKNALLMNSINEEINLKLLKKTNAERTSSEIVDEIAQGSKVLSKLSLNEIKQVNESIKKELAGIGLDSQEKIASIIESEEFKEEIVNTASYEHFMDNWKDKFFAYSPEELGMSEDERQDVWEQIEADNSFDKFVEKKVK